MVVRLMPAPPSIEVAAVSAEPRMEDLLASIRKAIHEDIGETPAARPAPRLAAVPPREPPKPREERTTAAQEIQELREKINRSRVTETAVQLRAIATPAPALRGSLSEPEPRRYVREEAPPPVSAWREEPRYEAPPEPAPLPILSADASVAASAAFNRLADTLLSRATGERSIEALTSELLRGMLKTWLDDNLPELVERLVREEIERVARRGR